MKAAVSEISMIEKRIQELCEAIAADTEVQSARMQAESFLADEDAVSLYREMALLGRSLHQKQHEGEDPGQPELGRYEDLRNRCDAHPLIAAFVEAQDVLGGVAEMVERYVSKTLERGEVPSSSEIADAGGCGAGCGCHH